MTPPIDKHALPNLAPRIAAAIFTIWFIVLLGQWLQNNHRHQELETTSLINLYHQQLEFSSELINIVLAFQISNNDVAFDSSEQPLKIVMNQLKSSQEESNKLLQKKHLLSLSEYQHQISGDVDEIILHGNEILAMIESGVQVEQRVDEIDALLLEFYSRYQHDTNRIIAVITKKLYAESARHQRMSWWFTALTMFFIFIVCLTIYLRSKKLVHQQFNRISDMNTKLEEDNVLLQQAEVQIARQSDINLAQQVKLQSILDSTVNAVITIAADGAIDSFNKAAEKMFSCYEIDVIGKSFTSLLAKSSAEDYANYLEHTDKTGNTNLITSARESIGKKSDSTEFPIYVRINEVVDSTADIMICIIEDITDWKAADEKLQGVLTTLRRKQKEAEEEERIARHVFEAITKRNNDTIPEISLWSEPMGIFSGDMMLSTRLPSGNVRVILCDFTGHGLPAALGAVPVSVIHSAMAKKGLPLEVLMKELNDRLNDLLPIGIFCCIAGIDLDAENQKAFIWNAGLPEVLIVSKNGGVSQRVSSTHLPLGVVSYDEDELHCEEISLEPGDSIYALSDGLTEAENEAGTMFGQQQFEKLLMQPTDEEGRLLDIRNSLANYVGKAPSTDDVSLIEIKTLVTVDDIILEL